MAQFPVSSSSERPIHAALEQRGIECLVVEPASLQVNRRARRVKTDRIDVESILHTARSPGAAASAMSAPWW